MLVCGCEWMCEQCVWEVGVTVCKECVGVNVDECGCVCVDKGMCVRGVWV